MKPLKTLKTFAEFLNERSAPINKPQLIEDPALSRYVIFRELRAIKDALAVGVNPDSEPKRGDLDLPLIEACYNGYTDIAKLLLENGADVNAQASRGDGLTALLASATKADKGSDIVDLILSYSPDLEKTDFEGNSILKNLVYGYPDAVHLFDYLLERVDLNKQNKHKRTALHDAVLKSRDYHAHHLLKAGALLIGDSQGRTPLDVAIQQKDKDMITLLRDHFNINERSAPIKTQTLIDEPKIAVYIAENGKDISVVKDMLEQGYNPNSFTKYGFNALYYALNAELYEMAKLLLENGADVEVASTRGKPTPQSIITSILQRNPNDKNIKAIYDIIKSYRGYN